MGVEEKYRGRPPLPGDWAERLPQLPSVVARHGVSLAYLFGSAAPEEPAPSGSRLAGRPPGDIDIAYLPGPGFRFRPFYADVSQTLGTDRVDLINLRTAPAGLMFEIISRGRVLHRESAETQNVFEKRVLGLFRDATCRLAHLGRIAQTQH